MRKQTKIAAIVSAAALLALGASITSFAAVRGTWRMEDGEWKCYDKNGDAYENVFAVSNGKEYYVGEDGLLVRSDWVEYDGSYYFVNSAGQKITNDWRLTTPYDAPDEDEEWYYFQSSGKRADGKKIVWKDKTYYFDSEGKMLTGWVTADSTEVVNEENEVEPGRTYYCGEDGARITSDWIYTTEPSVEEDDADADSYYYWLKSNGKVATGKVNSINGQTYIFDQYGKMLTGWVAAKMTDNDAYYEKIDKEDSNEYIGIDSTGATTDNLSVYWCGDEHDGHVRKGKWKKLWMPHEAYEQDSDTTQYWYYFEKDGKVYLPNANNTETATIQGYSLVDGVLSTANSEGTVGFHGMIGKKKVNSKDYFIRADGRMVSGFMYVEGDVRSNSNGSVNTTLRKDAMYYLGGGDDGSMKTGSQSIKDDNGDTYKFYFGTSSSASTKEPKGAGITGNKSNKLYYYGRLVTSEDYKYLLVDVTVNKIDASGVTPETHTFIINQNGSIQHSAIQYKEDGDILINASTKNADGVVIRGGSTGNSEITFKDGKDNWKYAVDAAVVENLEGTTNTGVMVSANNIVFAGGDIPTPVDSAE